MKSFVHIILLIALFITGCRVKKPIALQHVALPPAFRGEVADSTGIADLPWRALFNDSHLIKLIDTTLANNPDMLQAIRRIEVARNQFLLRNASMKPRVDAQIAASVDKFGRYTMNGVGNFDTNLSGNINDKQRVPLPVTPDFFTGFRSSWEIDLWGKLKSQREAAYNRYLASESGMRLTRTWLVAEVMSRYFELLAFDNELKVIRQNIALQDSAFQIVQVLKDAARVNELAVQQFRAQLLNTRGLEGRVLTQINTVQNEIKYLQGALPGNVSRDTSIVNKQLPSMISAGVPSRLLERRPDIRQASFEVKAADADLYAARAAYFPSVVLSPYLALNTFKLPLLFSGGSLAYGVLGSATAPLIHQGALRRNEAIADATRYAVFHRYNQTILNGMKEVVNSLNTIENLRTVYSLKEEEVTVLFDAVSTSNLLFKTGYATYLEVIMAQRNVIDAELQLVDTKKEMFLSVIELYRALGGGWQD